MMQAEEAVSRIKVILNALLQNRFENLEIF
jgi:hypothetical protein